jgi:hypothetical protein
LKKYLILSVLLAVGAAHAADSSPHGQVVELDPIIVTPDDVGDQDSGIVIREDGSNNMDPGIVIKEQGSSVTMPVESNGGEHPGAHKM